MSKFKETPVYIKSLLSPTTKAKSSRRIWSVDLETVWLPFFTATNTMGDTAIPHDALGAPLRLAYAKDGSVKFGASGRPVVKVAKSITESVSLIRENFVAHLQEYAETVATERQTDYAGQVEMAQKAGVPITNHDSEQLDMAIQAQLAEAIRQAECQGETEADPDPDPEHVEKPARELVNV